ncbi:hypothetical protein [Streptomyces chrestomyceticus]|uniref:hypothetical protein n=1 Tax=Streptomyces chrestomyceticus TaxID=68185 RepID=UPI0033D04A78
MPSRTPHQGSRPGRTPAAARSAGAAPTVALDGRGLDVAGIATLADGTARPAALRAMLAVRANQLPARGCAPAVTSLGARQTPCACVTYRWVLACELVPAVRTPRTRAPEPEPDVPAARAVSRGERAGAGGGQRGGERVRITYSRAAGRDPRGAPPPRTTRNDTKAGSTAANTAGRQR